MTKSAIQNFFPDFLPNQLLTNVQLNQLRQYLDEQNRLTRTRLVGMGVVCGLTAKADCTDGADPVCTITLRRGYGVTSDGYLIEVPAPSLIPPLETAEAPPADEECLPEVTLVRVRRYDDPYLEPDETGRMIPVYPPWRRPAGEIDPDDPDAPTQIPILELLTQEQLGHPAFVEEAGNVSAPITPADLEGKVLVLYLEFDPKNLKSCLTTDCTNKGQNLHLNVRVLLVPKAYLQPGEPCERLGQLIEVPRLYHGLKKTANLDYLEQVTSSDQIAAAYADLSAYIRNQLLNRIPGAFAHYRNILDIDRLEDKVNDLAPHLPDVSAPQQVNQYHYDFYKDLADAYNEFATHICKLVPDCCQPCDFPRHLMITCFDEEEAQENCLGFEGIGLPEYGANFNEPGEEVLNVHAIRMRLESFTYFSGDINFNYGRVEPGNPSFGSGPVLRLNNLSAAFDFSGLGYVPETVTFDFLQTGGYDNLSVNGQALFIGPLMEAPANIAPGVTLTVDTQPAGNFNTSGRVTLRGTIQSLRIGGQELWIDTICAGIEGDSGLFRHRFQPSPVRNVLLDDLAEAEKMFERIICLAGHFSLPAPAQAPVKITPSQTEKHPLRDRALPYYYDYSKTAGCWQPQLCCTPPLLSYQENNMAAPGQAYLSLPGHPLTFNLNPYDFFRIEGQWGRLCELALNTIHTQRKRHNLEFRVRPLTLDETMVGSAVPDPLVSDMNKLLRRIENLQQQIVDNLTGGSPSQDVIQGLREEIDAAEAELAGLNQEWVQARKARCGSCDLSFLRSDYLLLRSRALCIYKNIQKLLSQLPEFEIPTQQEACVTFDEEPPVGTSFGGDEGPQALTTTAGPVTMTPQPFISADGNAIFGSAVVMPAFDEFGSGHILYCKSFGFRFDFGLNFTPAEVTIDFFSSGGMINLSVNADQGTAPAYIGPVSALPTAIAPGVTLSLSMSTQSAGTITLQGPVTSVGIGGEDLFLDRICADGATGVNMDVGMVAGSLNQRKTVLDRQITDLQERMEATENATLRDRLSLELQTLDLERKNIRRVEEAIRVSGDLASRFAFRGIPTGPNDRLFRKNLATARSLAVETNNPLTLVLWGAFFGLAYLRNQLEKLTNSLPKDVCAFNYHLFIDAYKEVMGALIEFQLLASLLLEYLGTALGSLPGGGAGPVVQAALTRWVSRNLTQLTDYLNAFQKMRYNCLHTEFATVFYTLEHLLGNRVGSFRDFARSHPGMEHLAGVEKGGTFILLCERGVNNAPTVVADFALRAGSCCCDLSTDQLCLPPVALPDYRIVTREEDQAEPAVLLVDVLGNDFGLNEDPDLRLEEAPQDTANGPVWRSRLGGALEIVEEEDGHQRIRYAAPAETQNALDSFRYRVVDDNCGLRDEAEVYMLIRPAAPNPIITVEHYAATTRNQPVDVDIMMSSPWNLQTLGTGYTLTAQAGPAMGGNVLVKTATILNQTRQIFEYQPAAGFTGQDFFVYQISGNGQSGRGIVRVLVTPCCDEPPGEGPITAGTSFSGIILAAPGEPLIGASLIMTRMPTGQTFGAITNVEGQFQFSNLQPGNYQLTVSVPGFQTYTADIIVTPNGPGSIPAILLSNGPVGPRGPRGFDVFVGSDTLARLTELTRSRTGLSADDSLRKVATVLNDRQAHRKNMLAELSADAGLARTKAFRLTENFVAAVEDPDRPIEIITEGFRETANALVANLKRAQGERRDQYLRSLEIATHSYLDRLAATRPETLTNEQEEVLLRLKDNLQEVNASTEAIRKNWKGKILEDELGITSARSIDKTLK